MAIWQFSIVFIPKSWAEENGYCPSSLYSGDDYDTALAWRDKQPAPGFEEILSHLLPLASSPCCGLLSWGDEKENDIQVRYENGMIDGIHIRLDLHQNLNELIAKLIHAANDLDCVLFYPELKTITEANEFKLKRLLQGSRAAEYLDNPRKFLEALKKQT